MRVSKRKIIRNIFLTGLLGLSLQSAFAYTPPFLNDENYQKGIISLSVNNYEAAINELNQALVKFPHVIEIKNNLSDAYYKRGIDFSTAGDYKRAANDIRAAIFYLKYYQEPTAVDLQKVTISENILRTLIGDQNLSTSPSSRFNEAKKLRSQGFFPQAVVEFTEASKDQSVRALALENIADLFVAMGEEKQAVPYYEDALEISPLNSDMHLKLAEILDRLDITDKAIEEYNLAFTDENSEEVMPALERLANINVAKYPDKAVSYLNLGAVYQRKGDFASAMTNYQKAQSLDSSNPVMKINIGSLYLVQGNCQKAIDIFNEVILSHPKDKLAYLYKAKAYWQLKNYTEAVKNYEEVLKIDPKDAQAKSEMLDSISNMADIQAFSYFDKLIAQFPNDEEILKAYGNVLLKKKYFAKAVLQYQKVLVADGSDIGTYIALSQAYQGLYDFDNAIKTIDNGIFKNPDDKKLPACRAEILESKDDMLVKKAFELYSKKDYVKAIETYLLIKDPEKDVFTYIGACYQNLGKYKEAAENYSKALALDPASVDVLCYMGNISCLQNQFEKAKTCYNQALLLEPENPDAKKGLTLVNKAYNEWLLNQGISQYKAMDYKKALKTLSQLLTGDAQNAYGYYYRALSYDSLNDYRKAVEDYAKVTKLMPKNDMAFYLLGVDYDSISDFKNAKIAYTKFMELSGTKQTEYTKYAKKRLIELKNIK